jgi:hypothetical protein
MTCRNVVFHSLGDTFDRGAGLDLLRRIHKQPLKTSATLQPSQDRDSPFNNGEDAANAAG